MTILATFVLRLLGLRLLGLRLFDLRCFDIYLFSLSVALGPAISVTIIFQYDVLISYHVVAIGYKYDDIVSAAGDTGQMAVEVSEVY